jgi:hypothetical protein
MSYEVFMCICVNARVQDVEESSIRTGPNALVLHFLPTIRLKGKAQQKIPRPKKK